MVKHLEIRPRHLPEIRKSWVLRFDFPDQPVDPGPNSTLDDWLALGNDIKLRLYISYTDSYSGIRRTDRYSYGIDDVLEVYFAPTDIGPGRPVKP